MTSHSSPIAFLFPGQGSQAVGMGKELAALYPVARQTFDEADAALGYKLSQLCFEGPEDQLRLTEITQPAILTVSVAALRVLQSKAIAPSYVAGHSLGEYSAHVAAGTLSFTDAVRTVRNRGKYMQEAVPAAPIRRRVLRPTLSMMLMPSMVKMRLVKPIITDCRSPETLLKPALAKMSFR